MPDSKAGVLTAHDDEGNKLWTRIFGATGAVVSAHGVAVDHGERIYVTGQTWDPMDGQAEVGNGDMFVKVFDATGSSVWTRIWGSTSVDQGNSVTVDANSNIYVVGYARASVNGQPHVDRDDLCLTKLDVGGNHIWTRMWGGSNAATGREAAQSVVLDSQGNIYVTGYTDGDFHGQTATGAYDVFLSKFDATGSNQWSKIWGDSGTQKGWGLARDASDNVYVAGFGGDFNGVLGVGSTDAFIIKVSSAGVTQWTDIWGSTQGDYCYGIAMGLDGKLYTTGHAPTYTFDGLYRYDGGAYLTCHTTDGTRQWSRRWGASSSEGWGVAPADTNVLYVGGQTFGGFDGQPGGGSDDHLFLSRWGPYGPPRITIGPDVWSPGTSTATVAWTLNRDADGWVDYSRYVDSWDHAASNLSYATQHNVALSGLRPGTTYRYRVRSMAQDGQSVTSGVHNFTTAGSLAPGGVDHTVLWDGNRMAQLIADSSGDVDRVELTVNGQIVGSWYGDGAEWDIGEGTPGVTLGSNDLMITGYRPDGGIGTMSFGSLGFSNTGLATRCEIEDPCRGYRFLTDGPTAPDTNILLRVLAAKQSTRWIPGPRGGGRSVLGWGSVSNVRFYVDGSLVHTSTTAVPNVHGPDLHHEFEYNISGLSTGSHRFYSTFTPPSRYRWTSDRRTFSIEQRASDVAAWHDVDFNSVSNCLAVDLNIRNRGTGTATISRIEDSAVGFQIGRINSFGIGSETNHYYNWEARQSRFVINCVPALSLGGGNSIRIRYYAVPVLFPGGGDYQIGGLGLVRGNETSGAAYSLDVDGIETTVGSGFSGRVPMADAVSLCKSNSDYLVISCPVNLEGVYGEEGCGEILSTVAELATYRNAVLGYFHSANWVRTAYRSGDPATLGYTFNEWDLTDQVWVGDRSDNRLRAYSRMQEVRNEDIPVPVVADVRSGDGLAVGDLLVYDSIADPHPRQELAVAYGDGHGGLSGDIHVYKYRHDPTNGIFTSFDIDDTGYGTGGAILSGRFVRGWSNEVLAVFAPDGNLQFVSCYDSGGIKHGQDPTGYEAGDLVAAGDLFGTDLEEIVIADVDLDRISVYAESTVDAGSPKRYTQQAVYWTEVDVGDAVAVGDVLGGARNEVLLADASEDRIHIYEHDSAHDSLDWIRSIDWPFNDGDYLGVGRVGTLVKDQLVVVNGSSHDGVDAGVAQMFRIAEGDAPGDRYALDALINRNAEWARQLDPDWYRHGHLLLVGETEIIPAFRSSWEIYYDASYHTHVADFNDVHYANTHDAITKPDVACGRIPGNSIDRILAGVRTSLDIIKGSSVLDTTLGLAVSGEDDSHRFRPIRRDIADRLRGMGFDLVHSINNLTATGTLATAINRDLIFFSGHGNWGVWDGIYGRDVRDHFDAGSGSPLVYAASCRTARYPTGTGFAERFLQKGASAYIGATCNTYGDIDISFTRSFFNRLDDYPTIGEALKHAKRNRADTDAGGYPSERRWNRYHCAVYHYFGDTKLAFDWGATPGSLGAVGLDAAETNDFTGPISTLDLTVPPFQVEQTNGVDSITIPGEGLVRHEGRPVVPQYAVTVSFPSGCVVQAVSLNQRSGEAQLSGLNPPVASLETNSVAPRGGLELDDVAWWPDRVFDWSVEDDGDGSILSVVMYPFYHNTNGQSSLFYSNYVFDVSYNWSGLAITDVTTDRHTYSNGQAMVASVYLHSTNPAPMNVVLHPRAVCMVDDSVTALPIRELRDLSGWAGCRLTWDVAVPRSGEYLLEVAAVGDNEVVLDRATTPFEVGGADAVLRDAGVSPQDFMLGNNVTLDVTLDNTGTVDIDGSIHILVQDGAGNTVAQFQHDFTSLTPGGSVPFNTSWTDATLLPRNCRVIFYAVYGGRTTSLQTLADGSADPLVVESIGSTGDQCVVTWPSMAGTTYAVWGTSNLLDGFTQMTSGIPASPPYNSYTNPAPLAPMFYRIEEQRSE